MDFNRCLSREIVKIALDLRCGIKFELISKKHNNKSKTKYKTSEFFINNWYFYNLCQMVEDSAAKKGVSVLYVNPAFT